MDEPVILHLSDLHRTKDERISNSEILQWLIRDIEDYKEYEIPLPNILVISGDLNQHAEKNEYDETFDLIQEICQQLNIKSKRTVVVPGNHDIHFPTCEKEVREIEKPPQQVKDLIFEQGSMTLGFPTERGFQARLENFRAFYKKLKGNDYPTGRHEACTIDKFDEYNLTIAGLSSVDRVHKYFKKGEFHSDSVAKAGKLVKGRNRSIVVWHHDLDWQHSGANNCLVIPSLE